MGKEKRPLWKLLSFQHTYFSVHASEIAARNLQLIRTVGFSASVLYFLYSSVTLLFFPQWSISPLYSLIVPILFGFTVYAHRELRLGTPHLRQAQVVTLLMDVTMTVFILVMSIFPHPDVASAYFSLYLLLAPVMFILPVYQHLLMTIASETAFFLLVFRFKDPACWSHELFEATVAAAFSVMAILLMSQFQIQSDSLKDKYYLLSRQDGLTETLNKSGGKEAADAYMRGMRPEELCALFFLDIDNFKYVNDIYGHMEGDRLLREVGNRLLTCCRKEDIVCRFGGDEFLLLLKNISDPDAARRKAESILDAIRRIRLPDGGFPTCSIGLSIGGAECRDFAILQERADRALYQVKTTSKNGVAVY